MSRLLRHQPDLIEAAATEHATDLAVYTPAAEWHADVLARLLQHRVGKAYELATVADYVRRHHGGE